MESERGTNEQRAEIAFEAPQRPLSRITYYGSNLEMYIVPGPVLDELGDSYASPAMGMLGIAVGIFAAALVTLLTVPLEPQKWYGFAGVTTACGLLALFFGWNAWKDWRRARARIQRIRATSAPIQG